LLHQNLNRASSKNIKYLLLSKFIYDFRLYYSSIVTYVQNFKTFERRILFLSIYKNIPF
jgi:hypothetical protein